MNLTRMDNRYGVMWALTHSMVYFLISKFFLINNRRNARIQISLRQKRAWITMHKITELFENIMIGYWTAIIALFFCL